MASVYMWTLSGYSIILCRGSSVEAEWIDKEKRVKLNKAVMLYNTAQSFLQPQSLHCFNHVKLFSLYIKSTIASLYC